MKKIFVTLTIVFLACAGAYASDQVGSIAKYTGRVQLFDGISPRPQNIDTENVAVFINNKVATKADSTAIIKTAGEDIIALDANSVMSVKGANSYSPEAGQVVFSIKKRGTAEGINIPLTSAVIGVKGTKFLVKAATQDKCVIYLKEGKLEVTAIQGQFKKYAEVQMDEYEAYIRQMAGELEDYVKELEEQYVEYVQSFTMEAGSAFSIAGNDVREEKFNDDVERAFHLLDGME